MKAQVAVRQLCAILGLSRTWYYRAAAAAPSEEDTVLRARIEEIVLEFPGYGYRRVTKELARGAQVVNHKRVLRILREESLLCQLKRRWAPTTDSRHSLIRYPNLIKGRVVTALNAVWVADITYIRLPRGFAYLAAILDALSRKIVGWALSPWIDTELTLRALEHAVGTRTIVPGLIHHSDQGVQYAATAYVAKLQEHGIHISMAAVGNPYENAQAEAFFKTLKTEEVYLKDYRTLVEAEAQIRHFITDVYNAKRLHSALGYRPPNEFEALAAPAGMG